MYSVIILLWLLGIMAGIAIITLVVIGLIVLSFKIAADISERIDL